MESKIGLKVRLKRGMLGNPVGAVGYVFNEYKDFDHKDSLGIQVILPTGSYDGFSVDEQNLYLEELEIDPRYSSYKFKNVNRVWEDYKLGYWKFY